MSISHFIRCWEAKAASVLKVQFFRPGIVFWNTVFPIFWGLQFYFQYLPFGASLIVESFFGASVEIPLVGYTLTGQFVWMIFINASLYGGIFFLYERLDQTLETMLMSPAPRTAIMLGAATAGLVNFMWFIAVFSVLMAILQVPVVLNDPLACAFALGLTLFAMLSTGLLLQGLFVGTRIGDSLATAIQEPMMFLSGLAFPTRYLPSFLVVLAFSIPLTYGLFLFRGTLMGGLGLSQIVIPASCLMMLCVVVLLMSIKINRMIEMKIKRDATVNLF